jgi:subtilisin family serine protease
LAYHFIFSSQKCVTYIHFLFFSPLEIHVLRSSTFKKDKMIRNLLRSSIAGLFLLFTVVTHAQIKGDPTFGGTKVQVDAQKPGGKLSPDLKKLYDTYSAPRNKVAESTQKPSPVPGNTGPFMEVRGDKVVVDITVKEDAIQTQAELKKIGVRVTATYGHVISGLVPIGALPQLENISAVRFVRAAYKPLHHKAVNSLNSITDGYRQYIRRSAAGSGAAFAPKPNPVISQGDTAQLSYLARKKHHVDGTGVKVGVMSDSYNNLGTAAIGVANGELPGPGNRFNYRQPVQVLQDLDSGGTDEGRAMLEIVHDVAPGASLAFHTANLGQANMAQGILQLAAAGCDIIGDDALYFAEPFFQDGIIAQAVDQVKAQGVTYFSAAGNESIRAYTSVFQTTTIQPLGTGAGFAHNFSGPADPQRIFQPIFIPPGGTIICSFQWDQSSFSASGVGDSTDMDIYLINSLGQIVAAGNSDNIASGDPIEIFGYQNNTPNSTFFLVIVKFAGPDPQHLKYILYNDALFFLTTPAIPGILSPTLVGHPKAAGAIACGAAFYLQTPPYGVDTPIVEGYSSEGGVPNYYDIAGHRIPPLIRQKPDIVAPDGVNTSFFDPFGNGDIPQDADNFPNFFGTSAATPHAEGAAALMIDAQKLHTITPAQIKGILTSHTWDMDDPNTPGFDAGFDFATGFGLIKVNDAVTEVTFPNAFVKDLQINPLCTSDPNSVRNWQIVNPNSFDMAVQWHVIGGSQQGSLVVSPGDTSFSTTLQFFGNYPIAQIIALSWQDNFDNTRLDLAISSGAVCGKDQVSGVYSDRVPGEITDELGKGRPSIAEIYPNPSSGIFRLFLYLPTGRPAALSLFSADGKQLQARVVEQPNGIFDIDASSYRPGIYILRVAQTGGFVRTIKLIKR